MIKGEIRNNQILELVNEHPGLNFRDIMRFTGLKNGVISYHVKKLERKNKLTVKRKTGNTRFFPLDVNETESILLEMIRRPTPKDIILLLEKNPSGLTLNQIVEYTSKAQSTISVNLQLLVAKKILSIRFHDRKKIFTLKNIESIQYTLKKYEVNKISKAVQNFNDMFESL